MENPLAGDPLKKPNPVVVNDPRTFMQLCDQEYLFRFIKETGGWSNVGELFWGEEFVEDEEGDFWEEVPMFTVWNGWDQDDTTVKSGDIFWVVERPKLPELRQEDVL